MTWWSHSLLSLFFWWVALTMNSVLSPRKPLPLKSRRQMLKAGNDISPPVRTLRSCISCGGEGVGADVVSGSDYTWEHGGRPLWGGGGVCSCGHSFFYLRDAWKLQLFPQKGNRSFRIECKVDNSFLQHGSAGSKGSRKKKTQTEGVWERENQTFPLPIPVCVCMVALTDPLLSLSSDHQKASPNAATRRPTRAFRTALMLMETRWWMRLIMTSLSLSLSSFFFLTCCDADRSWNGEIVVLVPRQLFSKKKKKTREKKSQ